ncbi:MAG: hypothetical protein VB076_07605 [Synergistaceae bacterium]|nr:hypothetical protein [Synergistaceae bacterium]
MVHESRESFNKWVHKFGISSSLLLFVMMSAFPISISYYYNVWPVWAQLWPAALAVLLFLVPWYPAETVGYMSVMGPGAIYMSYITGNVTNLRMPATVGTINSLGIEPNSDACHTMAIIVCGGSVITTVSIVAIGVLIAEPLEPILAAPVLQPAFKYVVPAIFGGLVAQTILKTKKSILFYIIPLIISLLFCYFTKINSAYYMLIVIMISAAIYIVDYKNKKA